MSICSVPFWQSDYPEFEDHKEIFLNEVNSFKEKNPTIQRSNVGGYQSPPNLQQLSKLRPLYEYICKMASKACEDLDFIQCDIAITSAWLNINDSRQCMNFEHIHKHVFSGVFYLNVPERSGNLCISNLAINRMWDGSLLAIRKNEYTAERISIEPIEGNILLFPSYLPHYVETNDHDEDRISISFEIIALPKGSFNTEE